MNAPVVLERSHLQVRLCQDDGLPFLDVQSQVNLGQSFLLAIGHRPWLAGLSTHTPLGRFHALYWGLAYGLGELPARTSIRFESGRLRHHRHAEVAPRPLGGQCWVADAEGVFAWAVLLVGAASRPAYASRTAGDLRTTTRHPHGPTGSRTGL